MARTKQKNKQLAVKIGAVIHARRKAAGMTQEVLAEAVDLQPETISRLESGVRLPTIEKLVDLANVFSMPVAAFFEHIDTDAKQPESVAYAQKITVALDKLPEAGRDFVLEVAQNYARYHLTKPKKPRKTEP